MDRKGKKTEESIINDRGNKRYREETEGNID